MSVVGFGIFRISVVGWMCGFIVICEFAWVLGFGCVGIVYLSGMVFWTLVPGRGWSRA